MGVLRQHILTKGFTLLTGVIFLNTSFFLAELSFMQTSNRALMETIAKLISNSGLEEERDGESSEKDSSAKEIDFLIHQMHQYNRSSFLIATKANHMLDDHYPHANYSQTFSPPPDSSNLS
jgi:hypothetical protein